MIKEKCVTIKWSFQDLSVCNDYKISVYPKNDHFPKKRFFAFSDKYEKTLILSKVRSAKHFLHNYLKKKLAMGSHEKHIKKLCERLQRSTIVKPVFLIVVKLCSVFSFCRLLI